MDSLTFGSQRLVHLDLKGAPPKLSYFEKFFPFIKDLGATGLLIEWEDTFPYTGELIQLGGLSNSAHVSGAPYTIEEAKQLIDIATDCGLTIIPLVQTFGHLEYVLKHDQWKGLREVELYPSSICPSNSETLPLVRSMVKQIVAFHPNIQYIHIGADEVWHLGLCNSCLKRSQSSKHGKISIYLEHVLDVVQYIKDNFPYLKIIMWDDMFRNTDLHVLQDYHFGTLLVEPMVWYYNSAETFQLGPSLWDKYNNIFSNVWVASAFKGATSSCQILPINKHHVGNHEAWLTELGVHGTKIANFKGIALTGWSRFDHYATLCELLPCSIPTLCLCLKTWLSSGSSSEIYGYVSKLLGYTDTLQPEPFNRTSISSSPLNFPGWQIMIGFEWFLNVKARYKGIIESDHVNTWFNQWQVLNNYTNPMQLESLLPILTNLYTEIVQIENYLKLQLPMYFYGNTIEELIGTLILPIKQHLRQLKCECETQISTGCRIRGHKRLNIC